MTTEALKQLIRDNPDADDAAILAMAGDGATQDDVTAARADVNQENTIRAKAQQIVNAYNAALDYALTNWPLPTDSQITAVFSNNLTGG